MTHYLQRSVRRKAERDRLTTCERKRRHPSEWSANEAIRSLGDETLHAYPCEHCAGWHIGHRPEPVPS